VTRRAWAACIACAALCLAAGTAAPRCWTLRLKLAPGEQVVERRYETDTIDWRLPPRRMAKFRHSGIVINEERHIVSLAHARVVAVRRTVICLHGDATLTWQDIPRRQTRTQHGHFRVLLDGRNTPLGIARLPIEDAALAALPRRALRRGEQWTTTLPVVTNLGSGSVRFEHAIAGTDNGWVEVRIHGRGTITGPEYHLPKLLPGSIDVFGTAWYDPQAGLFVEQSYAIRDRLLKPMEGFPSGFDERRFVDIVTWVVDGRPMAPDPDRRSSDCETRYSPGLRPHEEEPPRTEPSTSAARPTAREAERTPHASQPTQHVSPA
jgi:hypothetical protein